LLENLENHSTKLPTLACKIITSIILQIIKQFQSIYSSVQKILPTSFPSACPSFRPSPTLALQSALKTIKKPFITLNIGDIGKRI
jgi:hypothetical protein